MGREQDCITKKQESDPMVECNKIQYKFYPDLFDRFSEVVDTCHSSYIDYSIKEILFISTDFRLYEVAV